MSCQQEFIPDTSEEDQLLVVEGVIEAGEGSNLTYVLLTNSIPFIGQIDANTLENLFIHDADIIVNDGNQDVMLTELCLEDLPPDIRELAATTLGFDPDSITLNICAYVDILDEIDRREGGEYNLNISVDGRSLRARTTIPKYVPIGDFRWDEPPGEPSDSLARLFVTIDDPLGEDNYYRYFTSINGEPLISPFASVAEDSFFDGKAFEFPLTKAQPRGGDFDAETFGLFTRGDTALIKWTTIDEAHFRFWNTLEFSANSGGPFSSYTRIQTNVEGGLGIWGGYATGFHELIVPKK